MFGHDNSVFGPLCSALDAEAAASGENHRCVQCVEEKRNGFQILSNQGGPRLHSPSSVQRAHSPHFISIHSRPLQHPYAGAARPNPNHAPHRRRASLSSRRSTALPCLCLVGVRAPLRSRRHALTRTLAIAILRCHDSRRASHALLLRHRDVLPHLAVIFFIPGDLAFLCNASSMAFPFGATLFGVSFTPRLAPV